MIKNKKQNSYQSCGFQDPVAVFDAVALVDTALNPAVFNAVMKEWRAQRIFSLSTGCEKLESAGSRIGPGGHKAKKIGFVTDSRTKLMN